MRHGANREHQPRLWLPPPALGTVPHSHHGLPERRSGFTTTVNTAVLHRQTSARSTACALCQLHISPASARLKNSTLPILGGFTSLFNSPEVHRSCQSDIRTSEELNRFKQLCSARRTMRSDLGAPRWCAQLQLSFPLERRFGCGIAVRADFISTAIGMFSPHSMPYKPSRLCRVERMAQNFGTHTKTLRGGRALTYEVVKRVWSQQMQ